MTMRRVAITGMGIISSLGVSLAEVERSLRQGRSGIVFDPDRKARGLRSALTSVIGEFELPPLPTGMHRSLTPGARMAVAACHQAVLSSGLRPDQLADDRTGILAGNILNAADVSRLVRIKETSGKKQLPGTGTLLSMTSTVSAHLSALYHTQGHCMTVSTACASGANAIGQAAQLIQFGLQDRILAGGAQEVTWEFACLFDALRVFSRREDAPTEASRPFDKDRDGLVPSGGSGFLMLEAYDLAERRGARILGEIVGFATNADGDSLTAPSGVGSARCMNLALANAKIPPDRIDYINAHATATVVGDPVEAQALAGLFGDRPFVSSTKSMTGHEVGAAGATELIYTMLMMHHGFVAPTINMEEIDPACRGMNLVVRDAVEANLNFAMSNSFGFGGVNAVLVIRRVES